MLEVWAGFESCSGIRGGELQITDEPVYGLHVPDRYPGFCKSGF